MNEHKLARGLGWFSIGLGVTELLAARPLARWLGLGRRAGLLRLFGAREILTGIGVLSQARTGPWIWARVAGDALDLALLGSALRPSNAQRDHAAIATANVAAVTALDLVAGKQLGLS